MVAFLNLDGHAISNARMLKEVGGNAPVLSQAAGGRAEQATGNTQESGEPQIATLLAASAIRTEPVLVYSPYASPPGVEEPLWCCLLSVTVVSLVLCSASVVVYAVDSQVSGIWT